MSSVLPLASGIVAASERSLPLLGRADDKNSSGAVFAVRPAIETQSAEPDVPRAAAPVVLVDVMQNIALADVATAPRIAAAAYFTAAAAADQIAQPMSPAADALNAAAAGVFVLPAVSDTVVTPSLAAYAYAQMMQAWLESKTSRQPARTAPKSKLPASR